MKIQTKHTTKPELREGRKPAEDDSNLSLTNHTPAPRTPASPNPTSSPGCRGGSLVTPVSECSPATHRCPAHLHFAPPNPFQPLPTPPSPSQPLPTPPSPFQPLPAPPTNALFVSEDGPSSAHKYRPFVALISFGRRSPEMAHGLNTYLNDFKPYRFFQSKGLLVIPKAPSSNETLPEG